MSRPRKDGSTARDGLRRRTPLAVAALAFGFAMSPGAFTQNAFAHEGHDHGAPDADAGDMASPPVPVAPPMGPAAPWVKRREWWGRVIADPRTARRVVADQVGRIDPSPAGFPVPGTRVHAGQVLGWLTPVMPGPLRRDLDAELASADRDVRYGAIQVQRFNVDEAEVVADDLSRPIPSIQILGEYRSAKARQGDLDRGLNDRVALVAPVDATVLKSAAQAGRVVAAGDVLFELAADGPLAIEVRGADALPDPHRVQGQDRDRSIPLTFLSDRFDPATRARVLLFAAPADAGLTAGQPLRLVAVSDAMPSASAASPAPPDAAAAIATHRIVVPKPAQRLLGIRTTTVAGGARTLHAAGEVLVPPDRAALVQAPEAGRLDAGPGGWPLPGRKVEKDEVLAVLHPQMSAPDRARRQAALAQIEQRLSLAKINVQRLRVQVAGTETTGNTYMEQAELDLETQTRLHAFAQEALDGSVPLRAAADGVLSAVGARPGDLVAAGATVFTVADPSQARIAVRVFDPSLAEGVASAHIAMSDGDSVALAFRGRDTAAEAGSPRGWRLLFDAHPEAGEALQPGQVVDVVVEQDAVAACDDGASHVWVHVAPEIFESRPRCPRSMAAGERMVVQGAAILDEYR